MQKRCFVSNKLQVSVNDWIDIDILHFNYTRFLVISRGVFKILSNIYYEADVWQGFYISDISYIQFF